MKKTLSIILAAIIIGGSVTPTFAASNTSTFINRVNKLETTTYKNVYVTINKGDDASDKIQAALNVSGKTTEPIKVIIPPGTYTLNEKLYVYGSTYIKLSPDTVLKRNFNGSMLQNGFKTDKYEGYSGRSNIVIDGGVWDLNTAKAAKTPNVLETKAAPANGSAFDIGHAHDILIKNLTVKDVAQTHAIDLAGVENVMVRNCKFLGFVDLTDDNSRKNSEAIQIDTIKAYTSFPAFGPYDGTPTRNVVIKDNYFGASGSSHTDAWGRGVGSHTATYAKDFRNIEITNNNFNTKTEGIQAFGWSYVTISDNQFNGGQYGVDLLSVPTSKNTTVSGVVKDYGNKTTDVLISNNAFTDITNAAINVDGYEDAYVKRVEIKLNKFTNIPSIKTFVADKYNELISKDF